MLAKTTRICDSSIVKMVSYNLDFTIGLTRAAAVCDVLPFRFNPFCSRDERRTKCYITFYSITGHFSVCRWLCLLTKRENKNSVTVPFSLRLPVNQTKPRVFLFSLLFFFLRETTDVDKPTSVAAGGLGTF